MLLYDKLHCKFSYTSQVRTIRIEKRINEVVNRLNKTKEEKTVDLRAEREERDRKLRENQKEKMREQKKVEKEEAELKAKEAEARYAW